jgi:hypothetical protein
VSDVLCPEIPCAEFRDFVASEIFFLCHRCFSPVVPLCKQPSLLLELLGFDA